MKKIVMKKCDDGTEKCLGNGMHLHLDKEADVLHCNYARLEEGMSGT